ncbi:MAG: hypothetical protein A4E53_02236 [Pelotomaculum sp. PtaB.Bin104]|nr:MAG: hypothetical protein A4E53_02236 [Pelotomaculum sp. PtaB.Bin104]
MYQYKVIATVVEIRGDGECSYGHHVGDSFEFTRFTPAGLCQFAYDSMRSAVAALLYGGQFPWAKDSDVSFWSCPDPERPVIFELKRVPVVEK